MASAIMAISQTGIIGMAVEEVGGVVATVPTISPLSVPYWLRWYSHC